MNASKMIAVLAVLAGCAGASATPRRELAVGHWNGTIDGAAWSQPLALEIASDGERYRGEWISGSGASPRQFQRVDVSGDVVRLESEKVVFSGRVEGSRLSGVVSDKANDRREAEFSLTYVPDRYDPGSEPAFPTVN